MSEPDCYMKWRHDAFHELMAKNDQLGAQFSLKKWPRWDYELEERSLTFSDSDGPKIVAGVRLIGSTSNELKNWQWGWANKYWPRQVIEGVDLVRAYGEKHEIAELTAGWIDDTDDLNHRGWLLSAVAARVMNGLGVYRPKTESGTLFFLYTDIRFVT